MKKMQTIKSTAKQLTIGAALSMFVFAPTLAVVSPVTTPAFADTVDCNPRFIGIPAWYRGLTDENNGCAIQTPAGEDGLSQFIWTIALNVIEMLLVASAYIAAGFIMYGGFIWLTGGANPQQVAKGRKTILNAVIGLIIVMGSIALNNLVFTGLVK